MKNKPGLDGMALNDNTHQLDASDSSTNLPEALILREGKNNTFRESDVLNAIYRRLDFIERNQIIALPDKHGLHFVQINKIMHCHSDNSYTEFYIDDPGYKNAEPKKIVVSRGFGEFEKFMADRGQFFRIHNQHLVNIMYINKYVKDDGNYLLLNDKHHTKIPVARARKELFMQFLKNEGILL